MPLEKCPKCEINFVRPGEKYCSMCKRSMCLTHEEEPSLCIECGENPAVGGCDLCAQCLAEKRLRKKRAESINMFDDPGLDDKLEDIDEPLVDDSIPENERQVIDMEFASHDSDDSINQDEEDNTDDQSEALKEIDELT
ncbi:MAG: hypothetical protein RRY79_07370 [Clostridia bacterium]